MNDIRLNLRDPKTGKFTEHVQTFVPMRKAIEYAQKEKELYDKFKGQVPQSEVDNMRIAFVADLYDDEKVTADYILNGLDTNDTHIIMDIILERVLGVNLEERKKQVVPTEMTM